MNRAGASATGSVHHSGTGVEAVAELELMDPFVDGMATFCR